MRNLWNIVLIACLIFGFALPANAQTANACNLLASHPQWKDDVIEASQRWGISKGAILAIIDQESRFRATASNGVNYGYAQSNPRTWNWFLRDADMGERARTDFNASAHFVGWHFKTMSRRIHASMSDVVNQYLVYKMGEGGYRNGIPTSARAIANRVAANARRFEEQLSGCLEEPPLELEN